MGCLAVFDSNVEVFDVFTDDGDVHFGVFSLDEGGIGGTGADVGIEAESGADGHVEAFIASSLRGGDGGLEEGVGAAQRIPCCRSHTGGMAGEVALFSDFNGVEFKVGTRFFEDMKGRGHDFWANAVSFCNRNGNFSICHILFF